MYWSQMAVATLRSAHLPSSSPLLPAVSMGTGLLHDLLASLRLLLMSTPVYLLRDAPSTKGSLGTKSPSPQPATAAIASHVHHHHHHAASMSSSARGPLCMQIADALSRELAQVALELSTSIIDRGTIVVGPDGVIGFSIIDARFKACMLDELLAAIDLVSTLYGLGMFTSEQQRLMQATQSCSLAFWMSSSFQRAWINLATCAAIELLAKPPGSWDPDPLTASHDESERLREELRAYLKSTIPIVYDVLCCHYHSPSTAHQSLFLLRLLVREPFLNRQVCRCTLGYVLAAIQFPYPPKSELSCYVRRERTS